MRDKAQKTLNQNEYEVFVNTDLRRYDAPAGRLGRIFIFALFAAFLIGIGPARAVFEDGYCGRSSANCGSLTGNVSCSNCPGAYFPSAGSGSYGAINFGGATGWCCINTTTSGVSATAVKCGSCSKSCTGTGTGMIVCSEYRINHPECTSNLSAKGVPPPCNPTTYSCEAGYSPQNPAQSPSYSNPCVQPATCGTSAYMKHISFPPSEMENCINNQMIPCEEQCLVNGDLCRDSIPACVSANCAGLGGSAYYNCEADCYVAFFNGLDCNDGENACSVACASVCDHLEDRDECTACPVAGKNAGGNDVRGSAIDGSNQITQCYAPVGTNFYDTTGSYQFNSNCHYSE
ncbi:MAG: hypothetical protein LBJ18_01915 [Rickettsiales bacterium]|jgi:hypothetical protein|nr:hypothetical protein [Rickettsiales bacterium]